MRQLIKRSVFIGRTGTRKSTETWLNALELALDYDTSSKATPLLNLMNDLRFKPLVVDMAGINFSTERVATWKVRMDSHFSEATSVELTQGSRKKILDQLIKFMEIRHGSKTVKASLLTIFEQAQAEGLDLLATVGKLITRLHELHGHAKEIAEFANLRDLAGY